MLTRERRSNVIFRVSTSQAESEYTLKTPFGRTFAFSPVSNHISSPPSGTTSLSIACFVSTTRPTGGPRTSRVPTASLPSSSRASSTPTSFTSMLMEGGPTCASVSAFAGGYSCRSRACEAKTGPATAGCVCACTSGTESAIRVGVRELVSRAPETTTARKAPAPSPRIFARAPSNTRRSQRLSLVMNPSVRLETLCRQPTG